MWPNYDDGYIYIYIIDGYYLPCEFIARLLPDITKSRRVSPEVNVGFVSEHPEVRRKLQIRPWGMNGQPFMSGFVSNGGI